VIGSPSGSAKDVGDGIGKARYHVLTVQEVTDAERGDRLLPVRSVPHVNLLPVGPHHPHQARPPAEIRLRLRRHVIGPLVERGHFHGEIRGKGRWVGAAS